MNNTAENISILFQLLGYEYNEFKLAALAGEISKIDISMALFLLLEEQHLRQQFNWSPKRVTDASLDVLPAEKVRNIVPLLPVTKGAMALLEKITDRRQFLSILSNDKSFRAFLRERLNDDAFGQIKMRLELLTRPPKPTLEVSVEVPKSSSANHSITESAHRQSMVAPDIDGPIDRAKSALNQRDCLAALAHLTDIAPTEARAAQRLRFKAWSALGMFDELIAAYETADPRLRGEPALRLRYVQALASVGRRDGVVEMLTSSIFGAGNRNIDFLVQSSRFSMALDERMRLILFARIGRHAHELRRYHVVLIKCAHELLMMDRYTEFGSLLDQIAYAEPDSKEAIRLAMLRSQAAWRMGNFKRHLTEFNIGLEMLGVEPLELIDSSKGITPDNVKSNPTPTTKNGPLVSILMTTFNSEQTVEYAVRSILEQTYRNLELIVIDDLSADRTVEILNKIREEDSRLKLIVQPQNGGTYVAKNCGLKIAKGEFVTCQDSDDWAHPDKIVTMVSRLISQSSLIATAVQHVRCSPEKGLQCRREYVRTDYSSLFYRREPVIARLGFYDNVRSGADSEFLARLEKTFGHTAIRPGPELLSMVLWSEGTLSGSGAFAIDDDAGIMSPLRNKYRSAFMRWHSDAEELRIPFCPQPRPNSDIADVGARYTLAA